MALADKPIAETAKQRALRVALDYYRHPDPIARTKIVLSVVVASLSGAYLAWMLVGRTAGQRHASPGPVAAAHASWDHDCSACHRDFHPLRADSLDLAQLVSGAATNPAARDQTCIKCHAGPPHQHNQKMDEVASCTACHREHHGRDADIARPDDRMCAACHANIDEHRDGADSATPSIANVTGFGPPTAGGAAPHPSFRSLNSDPGNIKFNHWLHMQPGLAVRDAKQKLLLSDIDQSRRRRYEPLAGADGLVQLDCAACHLPERGGDYMQPIAYEQHCKACHPLQLRIADKDHPPVDVPHGLTADRLAPVLDGLIFASERRQLPTSTATGDETGDAPLVPGKTLGKNLAQKLSEDVLQRRATMAAAVGAKCLQCHSQSQSADHPTDEFPKLLPSHIPAVWLKHARFDHGAHRGFECRLCHAEAYSFEQRDQPRFIAVSERAGAAARDNEQVMIANLESCIACHAPKRGDKGGSRFDCAECHAYHGGDSVEGRTSDRNALHRFEGPRVQLASAWQLKPSGQASATSVTHSSCAAAGCHGDARVDAPAWRRAFTTWLARDPHAKAYEVLWTFRSREMTRQLAERQAGEGSATGLSDEQHLVVLQRRCIGCHATPAADSADRGERHALGVHCQSCHGAAGEWLHEHYRQGFSRDPSSGFVDTKNLDARAGVCMPCHVGPSPATGETQVVNHDLIAAGHPRLNFEFHAYFESLPVHWDQAADERRHPRAFHYGSWLAGQLKQAEHRTILAQSQGAVTDFALLDCSACHHQLAPNHWRHGKSSVVAQLGLPEVEPLVLPSQSADAAIPDRLRLASELLSQSMEDGRATWDGAVQAYLAAQAIVTDVDPRPGGPAAAESDALQSALSALGRYLAKDCFVLSGSGVPQPTQYDSPTAFDPAELARRIEPVREAFDKLQAAIPKP